MRYAPSFLAALGLGAAACARRPVATSAAATEAAPALGKPRTVSTIPIHTLPTDTALVFQRTPCFGTCPAYTATVFRNGRVSYHGDRFVPVVGDRTLRLDPATVQAMVAEARRLNFNGLQHRYASNTSDLPATVVTSYLPGQPSYRVFAERGSAPKELQAYLDYLQDKLDPLAGLNLKE